MNWYSAMPRSTSALRERRWREKWADPMLKPGRGPSGLSVGNSFQRGPCLSKFTTTLFQGARKAVNAPYSTFEVEDEEDWWWSAKQPQGSNSNVGNYPRSANLSSGLTQKRLSVAASTWLYLTLTPKVIWTAGPCMAKHLRQEPRPRLQQQQQRLFFNFRQPHVTALSSSHVFDSV